MSKSGVLKPKRSDGFAFSRNTKNTLVVSPAVQVNDLIAITSKIFQITRDAIQGKCDAAYLFERQIRRGIIRRYAQCFLLQDATSLIFALQKLA